MIHFEIYQSLKSNEYYFRLKSDKQIILGSEGYTTKANAIKGIRSVQNNATEPKRYDIKEAKNGKCYFNLKARNGEVVGTSMMQSTKKELQYIIDLVKQSASVNIEDLTK